MKEAIDPQLLEFAKWAMIAVAGFLGTAIGFLFKIAFKLGQDATQIKEGLRDLVAMKEELKKVPILETRVGTFEASLAHLTSVTRSDIKELRKSNGEWKDGDS